MRSICRIRARLCEEIESMKLLLAVVRPASRAALLATVAASMSAAQQSTPPRPAPSANGTARRPAKIDQARAESLCHGGFIMAHLVMREETPFKAGAAIVRVTNLVFRLNYRARATSGATRRTRRSAVCRSRSWTSTSSDHRCTTWSSRMCRFSCTSRRTIWNRSTRGIARGCSSSGGCIVGTGNRDAAWSPGYRFPVPSNPDSLFPTLPHDARDHPPPVVLA